MDFFDELRPPLERAGVFLRYILSPIIRMRVPALIVPL